MLFVPIFYDWREGAFISQRIRFETLDDAKKCYGKENLIPIDMILQIIFYSKLGCQPVYICESELENKKGKLTCWYLKSETQYVYKKWLENRPENIKNN